MIGNIMRAWMGNLMVLGCFVVPAIGCATAIIYNSGWWLCLLLPLFVFMEGGLLLAAVATLTIIFVMGW